MSKGWEGALDALSGEDSSPEPQQQPAAQQGETQPGPGQATETVIEQKQPQEASSAPGDASPRASQRPSFMRSGDIPEDSHKSPEPKPEPPKPEPTKPKAQGKDGIAELRKNYDLTKAEKSKLEARVAELERTREEGTKAEVAKATAELQKQIETIRKAREDAEQELRFTRYQNSQEYREKYQEPLRNAYAQALEDIRGVQVVDEEGGEPREASAAELRAVLEAPSAAKAAQLASEMFGSAAPLVMQHRAEILKIENARRLAVEDYKARGAERERQKSEEADRSRREVRARWEKSIEAAVSERPSLYARPDGDDALGKAWDDGDKLVKLAFLGEAPPDVDMGDDPSAIAIEAQAEVAARVRGFNVLAHRNVALKRENESLREQLKKFGTSEPGQDTKAVDRSKPKTWEDALDEL